MSKDKEIDICIIGSGAGGAVAAYALGKAGLSVLVLEAGPRYRPSDYPANETRWEIRPNPFENAIERVQKYLTTYENTEKLDPAFKHLRSRSEVHGLYNDADTRQAPTVSRVKGVGGSTLHYQGEAHRFSAESFKSKSLHGVADDWPLGYQELEPYYELAENILGVAGSHKNPYKPHRKPFPNPPHELSCASKRVKKGFDKLGLHLLPNSLNILSKSREGRPACNYCNGCSLGCKTMAKGSMDVTFIKKAEATGNVEVRPGSTAREISINKNGKVDGVIYFDPEGREKKQKANIVVLSAGALETPRLLLNSKSQLFPDGLANTSGTVGKYLMETLSYAVTALFSEEMHSYKGLQIDSRAWDYNKTEKENPFTGGVALGVSVLDLIGPLGYARLLAKGWGREHKNFMKRFFGHAINIFAIGEHLPREKNSITIDPDVKDYHGIPVARITTRMRTNDLKMLSFMEAKCREIAEAAGAERIVRQFGSYDLSLMTHISGTCRMGIDPDKSVLNRYCQSHDVKNLFVVDTSCFVTEGGGDSPSLTTHAIALMASDYIVREMGRQG